jgi:diguanylate cyclase (GGDEF)-like protein
METAQASAEMAKKGRSKSVPTKEGTSEFSKKARVKVAVIYALTTIIPLLVMLYIIQSSVFLRTKIDVVWMSFLALLAVSIAVLGGKVMKEVWGKVSQAVQSIESLRHEDHPLGKDFGLKPTDEIDRIPTVVTHLVEIAKKQMNELKAYNKQVQLLNNKLKEANEKLHQISNEDSLTGLYNRRYFDDFLALEIARSKRFGRDLALAMLDIDFFKNYNDHIGHPAGDKALAAIGDIIRKSIRETDLPFRYGGEEFAIMLPETTAESAMSVAERIRSAVEKIEFPGDSSQPNGSLTISIGVATLGRDSSTQEEFVSAADKALYKAKSIGRNRVVAFSPD